MRRFTIVAALGAFVVLAAACSGGNGSTSSTTTAPLITTPAVTTPAETSPAPSASETAMAHDTLALKDNMFDPADLTIATGTDLTLDNQGAALHNFTVEGQDIDKDIQPGETETETIELPAGTYTIFCKYHRALGMEGTLTVTG
jgi:plastocyanin